MLPHHHLYEAAWGAAGLAWGFCGALLLRRRAGGAASWPRLLLLVVLAIGATLAGARAHFVLLAPDLLHALGWRVLVVPLAEGAGLRITGGLLAGLAVLVALGPFAAGHRVGRAAVADALVPAVGLAVAVGRLGCFADGCCFGTPCAGPWCLRFPSGSPAWWNHVAQGLVSPDAAVSGAMHPVQLYLGFAALLSGVAAVAPLRRTPLPDGVRALAFVVVFSLLRALVEPLRESRFGAGVPHESTVDLLIAAVAGALLARRLAAQRGPEPLASDS
jgi:phosphatidylglycerol:prolipoprotein diacylglycerol transferase